MMREVTRLAVAVQVTVAIGRRCTQQRHSDRRLLLVASDSALMANHLLEGAGRNRAALCVMRSCMLRRLSIDRFRECGPRRGRAGRREFQNTYVTKKALYVRIAEVLCAVHEGE